MKSASDCLRYRIVPLALSLGVSLGLCCSLLIAQSPSSEEPELNDVHFHLTNYIQQGPISMTF